jgi:hypothetical protein
MKYSEISKTMRMFIGNREAFRKLGFSADDLYCQIAKSLRNYGVLSCFLVLKTQNSEFLVECGEIRNSKDFELEYKRACDALNSRKLSEKDLEQIYLECEAFQKGSDLIAAIMLKGIFIPNLEKANESKN